MFKEGKMQKKKNKKIADMILFLQRKIQTLDVLVKKAMVCRRNLVDEEENQREFPFRFDTHSFELLHFTR